MTEDPARMLRAAVLAKLRAECPELLPDEIEVRIYSRSRKQVIALVVIPKEGTREAPGVAPVRDQPFIPTPFQEEILVALEGKALRTDALGNAVDNRRGLFNHPGGVKELREQGLVDWHKRLGYYRPDAPPPGFEAEE